MSRTHEHVIIGAATLSVFVYAPKGGTPDVTLQIYCGEVSIGLPGFTPAQARELARLLNVCADEVEAMIPGSRPEPPAAEDIGEVTP